MATVSCYSCCCRQALPRQSWPKRCRRCGLSFSQKLGQRNICLAIIRQYGPMFTDTMPIPYVRYNVRHTVSLLSVYFQYTLTTLSMSDLCVSLPPSFLIWFSGSVGHHCVDRPSSSKAAKGKPVFEFQGWGRLGDVMIVTWYVRYHGTFNSVQCFCVFWIARWSLMDGWRCIDRWWTYAS